MKLGRGLLGLFLLLWLDRGVHGEELLDSFIRDVVSTFRLTSPTIIYDGDKEAPEICYTNQWVLCLPSKQLDSNQEENQPTGMSAQFKCFKASHNLRAFSHFLPAVQHAHL